MRKYDKCLWCVVEGYWSSSSSEACNYHLLKRVAEIERDLFGLSSEGVARIYLLELEERLFS